MSGTMEVRQPAFSFCAASKTFGAWPFFDFSVNRHVWKMDHQNYLENGGDSAGNELILGFLDLRNMFVFYVLEKDMLFASFLGYFISTWSVMVTFFLTYYVILIGSFTCDEKFKWIFTIRSLTWKTHPEHYLFSTPPPKKKKQATVGTHGHPPGFPSQLSSRKWEIPIHWFEGDK